MKRFCTIYFPLFVMFMVLFNLDTAWAQPQEVTFNFTGNQQSFVVPNRVFSIHIEAWGAQGADAVGSQSTGMGGLGGFAEGDLTVVPGQALQIFVGGQGTTDDGSPPPEGGGFNGGGDALSNGPSLRGGGGGASDVRVGGATFDDRVIVAAGGGGASNNEMLSGGDGGGLTGEVGGLMGAPAGGGTQDSGGSNNVGPTCSDGEFGLGGSAITTTCAGGGSGWYGGASGFGGGGGSSYIDGVENGSTTTGIREGNGLVVITFTPMPVNIPTLSEWGLIAMAGLLAFVGFIAIRKKNAAV